MYKHINSLLIIVMLNACASIPASESWPSDIPPQKIFVDYCQNISNSCATKDKIENHLLWIKRFYYGSILYPTGWNEMTDIVIATIEEPNDKIDINNRLDELGLIIALEWSKDNRERLIDSKMLSIWANALATSAENDQQIEFITRIEDDVDQILSSSLNSAEISHERYYTVEDYDNF